MNQPDTNQITVPNPLAPGDTLGIVAPAGPVERNRVESGLKVLADMGFDLIVPDEIYANEGYLAGSDKLRAGQVHRLFADPAVDGIICARGGYGAMRILPLLDVALIRKHPKTFVGFSDITALLMFFSQSCGIAAFHGPNVTTLAGADNETRDQFVKTLTESSSIKIFAGKPMEIRPGKATGPFYCGNLTVLNHLIGTPFEPDLSGAVLLIEDLNEAPYRIDRMLTQLRLAGSLDRLGGVALGTFSDCGPMESIRGIVADCLGDLEIPVLGGFAVGHTGTNLTLPVGRPACLDTDAGSLAFGVPAIAHL